MYIEYTVMYNRLMTQTQTKFRFELNTTRSVSHRFGTTHYYGDRFNAEWSFADGVRVSMRSNVAYTEFGKYGGRYHVNETQTSDKKARVYVDDARPFDVIESLVNRTRRPHSAYRQPVLEAFARIGIENVKLAWSQKAGCSMCPCSPGFIISSDDPTLASMLRGLDIWVTIPDVPMVDESKPARDLEAMVTL